MQQSQMKLQLGKRLPLGTKYYDPIDNLKIISNTDTVSVIVQ